MDENVEHFLNCDIEDCSRCDHFLTIYSPCDFCEDWHKTSEMHTCQNETYVRWGIAPFDAYACKDCYKARQRDQ